MSQTSKELGAARHTPGPWIAAYVPDLRATLIGTADRATAFARMESYDGTPTPEEQDANAALIAAAPELLETLRDITMFFALPGESSLERFERVAEEFRRETGILAPGKDAGAGSGQPEPDERRDLYDAWVDARVAKARAAISKAQGAS